MDLSDQIDAYLEAKEYKASTARWKRSMLDDFNRWQRHFPSLKLSGKVDGYSQYARENCFRKPKTADKQISTVKSFCDWLRETGRVEAFRLDEQFVGRPELRHVPKPPMGVPEIKRMLNIASLDPSEAVLRDCVMTLLSVVCGFSPAEIAGMRSYDVVNYTRGDEIRYCGVILELPRIVSVPFTWYLRDRADRYGDTPVFRKAGNCGEEAAGLTPRQVKARVKSMLATVNVSFEDAVPGDCQLRIAQHHSLLDAEGKRAAAAMMQTLSFKQNDAGYAYLQELRPKLDRNLHPFPWQEPTETL